MSKRPITDVAAGALLGSLEDLLVVALLVTSLAAFDHASRLVRYTAHRWIGDRHRTRIVFQWTHQLVRFAVVLALVAAALVPCAADMVLVLSRHARLSTSSLAPSDDQGADDYSILTTVTIIGTTAYATTTALIFVFVIDFEHCIPTFRTTDCRKSAETSYLTPTYLHLGFPGYKSPPRDVELAPVRRESDSIDDGEHHHVTIVSAPSSCPSDEVDQGSTTDFTGSHDAHPDKRSRLTSWLRGLIGACVVAGVFALVAIVVCAISKDASQLVAAVALNATLNLVLGNALTS